MNANKVACFDGTTITGVGLNVNSLRAVRKKFKTNEAIMKGEVLIFACSAAQTDDLLGETEVTSSDYAGVKALVNGEVDTFMGFKFVETELCTFNTAPITYNDVTGVVGSGDGTISIGEGRECVAFVSKSAILCAKVREIKGRITEIPNKHYAKQVYAALSMGCVRMEEVQVVLCYAKDV